MSQPIAGIIFDIDGVLVDSPHQPAWRAALAGFADPARLTTSLYQAEVAGKPRMDGARAVLRALGVDEARAESYAAAKQAILIGMIQAGQFAVFDDALRFLLEARARGLKLAAASSSKNANLMLAQIALPDGQTLIDAFDANLCGVDVPHGKPAPDLFLAAGAALGLPAENCLVVEDSPAGIRAAHAGGMRGLGLARHGDRALLTAAQAELVVVSLDEVAVDGLRLGTLAHCAPG